MYFLTVPEARTLRSKCRQDWFLLWATREGSVLGPVLGLELTIFPLCLPSVYVYGQISKFYNNKVNVASPPHYKCDILYKFEDPHERERCELSLQLTCFYSMAMPLEASQASLIRPPTAHPPRISSPAIRGQRIYLTGGSD